MHFLEAYQHVNEQIKNIVDTSKADTDGMDLAQMAEMMRALPKQQEMMRGYKVHVDLLQRVTNMLTANKIPKVVDLE